MAINVVARKLLWGRAGNQCAMPTCTQSLTVDLHSEESEILVAAGAVVGEEAHIRSSQPGGPRHDPDFPEDQLDGYSNLLLLCPTHHSIVDKNNGAQYSVTSLEKIKQEHEAHVTRSLGPDGARRRMLEERMAALLLLWEQKVDLNEWHVTSGQLNMPVPVLSDVRYKLLNDAAIWLFAKKWPRDFPRTVGAFRNLDAAFGDLVSHIGRCMEPRDERIWEFDRAYKSLRRWDPPEYERLFRFTQQRRFIMYGLVIETTKALNHLTDCVIAELDPFYRFETGAVLMRAGDGLIQADLLRVEYTVDEVEGGQLFPGIDAIREKVHQMLTPDVHRYDAGIMFRLNSLVDRQSRETVRRRGIQQ